MSILFDYYFRAYDEFMKMFKLDNNQAILQRVETQNRPLNIADIGGGTGLLADTLIRLGHQVTIIDPSENMTNIARQRNPQVIIVNEAFEKSSLKQSYDLIIMRDCLHHLPDHPAVLTKIFRWLKEGGMVIIQEFSPRSLSARLLFFLERCSLEKIFPVYEEEIARLMAQAGFKSELVKINRRDYLMIGVKGREGRS